MGIVIYPIAQVFVFHFNLPDPGYGKEKSLNGSKPADPRGILSLFGHFKSVKSHGNAAYKFWTSRDFPGVPISNARLPIAGDYAHQYGNAIEPYLGALMSGMSGVQGFSVITCRYRWLQVLTSSWWTVAAV